MERNGDKMEKMDKPKFERFRWDREDWQVEQLVQQALLERSDLFWRKLEKVEKVEVTVEPGGVPWTTTLIVKSGEWVHRYRVKVERQE